MSTSLDRTPCPREDCEWSTMLFVDHTRGRDEVRAAVQSHARLVAEHAASHEATSSGSASPSR